MMKSRGTADALSDALGAVVLISVVTLGIAIAGMAILSSPLPDTVPALNAEVSNTSEYLFLRHTGGDMLKQGEFTILVDGQDKTSAFKIGTIIPESWSVGQTLEYPIPTGEGTPHAIQIIANTDKSRYMILQVQVLPPTLKPLPPPPGPGPATPVPPPQADFSGTPVSGTAPLIVAFTDVSTNTPTSWSWKFGDGETSTLRNPSHTYTTAGIYTVTLTAANAGGSDSEQKTGYIAVTNLPSPVAGFYGNPQSGTSPLKVQFNDTSTNMPTSWLWDFGDGETSVIQNASHTYAAAGTYTVNLTATNAGGSDSEQKTGYITVKNPPPVANFYGNPQSGTSPLKVQFNDTSTNMPTSWLWDFGDGETSVIQNASHTYTAAGTYTVNLTATNAGGSDSEQKTAYITVTPPPTITPVPVRSVLLNTERQGDLVEGGYMQFRVTGSSSWIQHGSTRYSLNTNDVVRLTVGNDGKGQLYATSTTINSFAFNNVGLSINGVNHGTANLNGIWISRYDSYVSTLILDVPSQYKWTQLIVESNMIINGYNSSHIRVTGLAPSPSGGIMNLRTTSGDTYFDGGAVSYILT